MIRRCKRGESIVVPAVMFIVLNVAFFVILGGLLYKSSTGSLVYEQSYSKQIALMIDKGYPGMEIRMDFEKGFKVAQDNKMGSARKVRLNEDGTGVIVKLSNKGGYETSFFSDYDVDFAFDQRDLVIRLKEKESVV